MTMWANVKGADGPFYPYEINQSILCSEKDATSLNFDYSYPTGTENKFYRYRHIFSSWVKRSSSAARKQYIFGYRSSTVTTLRVGFETDHQFVIEDYSGAWRTQLHTTNLFRDLTNWMHIFYIYDSTQTVESDRVRLWINGNRITDFATETYPALNDPTILYDPGTVQQGRLTAGRLTDGTEYTQRGYMAETHIIDGWDCTNFDLITVNDFGYEKNGSWVARKYKYRGKEGYGNYGGYYTYANAGNLGQDYSGNNNHLTSVNYTTDNQVTDSPTNNHCTWNEADAYSEADGRMRYGGLQFHYTSTTWLTCRGTFSVDSGKWYYESHKRENARYYMMSWLWSNYRIRAVNHYPGGASWPLGASLYSNTGLTNYYIYRAGSSINTGVAIVWATDVMLSAIDVDEDKIWFGVKQLDGTVLWFDSSGGTTGDPENGLNPTCTGIFGDYKPIAPSCATYTDANGVTYNFGQWPFEAQPKGFKSLCSKNIDELIVKEPYKYNSGILRVGDGVDGRLVEFNENANDMVIIKGRDIAYNWVLADKTRGDYKNFVIDVAFQEWSPPASGYGGVGDLRKNKYELVNTPSLGFQNVNNNLSNYIDYQWKFGKQYGLTTVEWVGDFSAAKKIYHGLGREPHMIWVKCKELAYPFVVYHRGMANGGYDGSAYYMVLDSNPGRVAASNVWITRPNSEYFTVGPANGVNQAGYNYIAYVFTSIPGYSYFGAIGESGSTDGTFMWCGFNPAWFLHTQVTVASNWIIKDRYREHNNPFALTLVPDLPNTEYSANNPMDFCSSGVKQRTARTANGLSIYAAFAETPFKYTNAR